MLITQVLGAGRLQGEGDTMEMQEEKYLPSSPDPFSSTVSYITLSSHVILTLVLGGASGGEEILRKC